MDNKTISYYENNADSFAQGTIDADVTYIREQFTNLLPDNAYILDFGCGSGRDAKFFLDSGYKVDAVDGSKELCRLANEKLGVPAKQMYFNELNAEDIYDGIWACSSILHLSKDELADVFKKMISALKSIGIIYTSFKYGDFEGYRGDRYFTDFTENSFEKFIQEFKDISVIKYWISGDVRPGRENEKWLNLILRKTK